MAQVNQISQLDQIKQLDLGSMAASGVKKSSAGNLKFSDVMSGSTDNTGKETSKNRVSDSQTSKESYETSKNTCKKFDSKEITQPTEKTGESDAAESISDVNDIPEEAMETVDALKEAIAKVLGISKEELEEKMAELGMTAMDLLQNDSLKNLVLMVNQVSDVTELLTNETLCSQLADVLKVAEEFVNTADLELFSQAADRVASETQNFSPVLEQNAEVEEVSEVQGNENNVETSKEPILTVQREAESNLEENTRGNDRKEDDTNLESQFQQFVQKLSNSIQETDQVSMAEFEKLQQMQEIVEQVVERIKVTLTPDTTSMELQLNPENLGKVNVSVIAKNGVMTAAFTVENQLAKEALESQLMVLKENLNEQGVKVDAIEVTVAQQGLSQNDFSNGSQQNFQGKAKSSNHIRKIQLEDEEIEETEEEMPIIQGNGTVDFSA